MDDNSLDTLINVAQSGDPSAVAAALREFKNGTSAVAGRGSAAQPAHIADPSGGATTDAEARTAINAILVALEAYGITASS